MLKLERDFYNRTAIDSAAKELSEVCSIKIKEDEERYIITILPLVEEDTELIKDEFSNYVLGLMKDRALV